jgi:hypothetical protein
MTRMSTGPCPAESLNPSCSRTAVKIDGLGGSVEAGKFPPAPPGVSLAYSNWTLNNPVSPVLSMMTQSDPMLDKSAAKYDKRETSAEADAAD